MLKIVILQLLLIRKFGSSIFNPHQRVIVRITNQELEPIHVCSKIYQHNVRELYTTQE